MKSVVIVVNNSPQTLNNLDLAADLAARMKARLDALFVEDIDLLNLAGLPFAVEVDPTSGEQRKLSALTVTSQLQHRARRLQQQLRSAGGSRNVVTSLRVVRGAYFAEAMRASADVLFLSTSRRVSAAAKPGRKLPDKPAARATDNPVVHVLLDEATDPCSLLQKAADLTTALGAGHIVVQCMANVQGNESFSIAIDELRKQDISVRIQQIGNDMAAAVPVIGNSGCALLLMSRKYAEVHQGQLATLEKLHCPLVLVS